MRRPINVQPAISIHVPLAGDDFDSDIAVMYYRISIHVPLAGDDLEWQRCGGSYIISIHVPLAGDDVASLPQIIVSFTFLSTSPLRGTTWPISTGKSWANFYPRPPCGGRRTARHRMLTRWTISIHVPLAGDDGRGAAFPKNIIKISIHVPLAGDDHGVRNSQLHFVISIHVPLAGDDVWRAMCAKRISNFYPRPPCGGRPARSSVFLQGQHFYPRPPCGGRPAFPVRTGWSPPYFYPRPPCGGRPSYSSAVTLPSSYFYPRPPCGGRHVAVGCGAV